MAQQIHNTPNYDMVTFCLHEEDHTLGNVLRWMCMKELVRAAFIEGCTEIELELTLLISCIRFHFHPIPY